MENQDIVKYTEIINKRFNQIGKPYSKPRVMSFMADGETQELEEPKNTFSSMNFVLKLIMDELPGKHYVLMNKEQAIRFIRVAKQRILKTLNNNIDFINIHLSKPERAAFDIKKNGRFIEKLTHRLSDIEAKYGITDADLYRDTPAIIQKYMNNPLANSPEYKASNSPEYKASNSPEYKVVSHSAIIDKDIGEFHIKLEEIDEEDKEKHSLKQEVDNPVIVQSIDSLKEEFIDSFTRKIHLILEYSYDEEVKKLKSELIQYYTERLVGIRNSAHFKGKTGFQPETTRIAERRKKEKERLAKHQLNQPPLNQPPLNQLPLNQFQLNQPPLKKMPKPRKSRRNKIVKLPPTAFAPTVNATAFAPTAFAPTAFAPTAFAPTAVAFSEKPKVPVPRTRKKPTVLNAFAPPVNAPANAFEFVAPLTGRKVKAVAANPLPRCRKVKAVAPPMNAFAPPMNAFAPTMNVFAPTMNAPKKLKSRANVVNPKPKTRKPRNTTYSNTLKAVGKRASNARQLKFNQPNTSL